MTHTATSKSACDPLISQRSSTDSPHKKSPLVSKIRKVFVKPGMSSGSTKQPRLTSSAVSPGNNGSRPSVDQHRGSVSSSSSGQSMSIVQADPSLFTPSTSPSPTGSPNLDQTSVVDDSRGLPSRHSAEPAVSTVKGSKFATPPGKSLWVEPPTSRASKKRLSFASITSFFRVSETTTRMSVKKKQQRPSSVPHAGNPIVITEQHLVDFQRRHSVNGITDTNIKVEKQEPTSTQTSAITPWAHYEAIVQNSKEGSNSMVAPDEPAKKSRIYGMYGMFGKQSKKDIKGRDSTSGDTLRSGPVAPARPLRSALVHRQRLPSIVRTPSPQSSIYTQTQDPHTWQHHYHFPQPGFVADKQLGQIGSMDIDFSSPDASASRRTSEEQKLQRIAGPTRHRRQSSLAGRQASQQGHYPIMDRKQRSSFRHFATEDDSWLAELFARESAPPHQQYCPPPLPIQGRYSRQQHTDSGAIGVPMKPRVMPINTTASFPSGADDFTNIPLSPMLSTPSHSSSFDPRRSSTAVVPVSHLPTTEVSNFPMMIPPVPRAAEAGTLQFTNPTMFLTEHQHQQQHQDYQQDQQQRFQNHQSFHAQQQQLYRLQHSPQYAQRHPQQYPQQYLQQYPHQYPQHHTQQHSQHYHQQYHEQCHQQHLQQHHHLVQQQQHQLQGLLPLDPFQAQHAVQHQQHLAVAYPQQFMNTPAFPSPPPPFQKLHQDPGNSYSDLFEYDLEQTIPSHLYYTPTLRPVTSQRPQVPPPLHPQQIASSRTMTMPNLVRNVLSSDHYLGGGGKDTILHTLTPMPTPKPPRQIQFSTQGPMVHTTWAPEQYDRTGDPNVTAHVLTPALAQEIKSELNQFKSQEMIVHQDSRAYTHFFPS
ncbi:bud neck involved protein [Mortierella sp. GBA43]|nr:bud neck involved protein [Mortierella sp. GBA43]